MGLLETWSGRTSSLSPEATSGARRIFTVSGAASEYAALTYSGVPTLNDEYVDKAAVSHELIRCRAVTVRTISVGYYEVTCDYAVGNFPAPADSPLDEPPNYAVEPTEIEEEVDHDFDKLPIQNLCGSMMPGAKRTFHIDIWRITKNLATYPYDTNLEFRNTTNSDDITLDGVTVPAGYGRVVSITPTRPFRADDNFVPCVLTLAVYDTQQPPNPWQHRIANQGAEAYGHLSTGASTPVKGRIVLKGSEQPPSRDVLLDANGKPFDTSSFAISQKHGEAMADTFDNSAVASTITGTFTIAPDTSTTGVVYLIYRKCDATDWSSLTTMFG